MSNHQTLSCFICNIKVTAYRHGATSTTEYECTQCGRYYLTDSLKGEIAWIRPVMFYYLLHENSGKRTFFVSRKPNDAGDYSDDVSFITREALESMFPKSLNEKVDMIMLNLGKKIKFWGDGLQFGFSGQAEEVKNQNIMSGLILMCSSIADDSRNSRKGFAEINGTLKFLVDYGYLERKNSSQIYSFTVDGWKYLGELQSTKHEIPQAFIAMWFSQEMDNARDSIKKAIIDCGYTHRIIDEKEHNNQIVPEILYEIHRSMFLVADLTEHRNGVYFEAGYAKGLGKEVILTCREEDFKKRHFDVAQVSTIVWRDEKDLYERLQKRIEATVGKRM